MYRTSHLHYWGDRRWKAALLRRFPQQQRGHSVPPASLAGYIPGLIPATCARPCLPARTFTCRPRSSSSGVGTCAAALRRKCNLSAFHHVSLSKHTALPVPCRIIHGTGLGLPKAYLNTFVMLFGTNLLGGTFNVTLMQIFIQGLFVTLVINRWWQIRSLYAKVHSVTVDLAITASSFIQPPLSGNAAPEKVQMMKRARAKASRGRGRQRRWSRAACMPLPSRVETRRTRVMAPADLSARSWPATSTWATS